MRQLLSPLDEPASPTLLSSPRLSRHPRFRPLFCHAPDGSVIQLLITDCRFRLGGRPFGHRDCSPRVVHASSAGLFVPFRLPPRAYREFGAFEDEQRDSRFLLARARTGTMQLSPGRLPVSFRRLSSRLSDTKSDDSVGVRWAVWLDSEVDSR